MPVLSGCAALATPQYSWYHYALTGQAAQQRFSVDNGACTAAAYREVGQPPESRDTVTDFSASTSSGEQISGQARTTTGGSLGSITEGMQKVERENQYRAALNSVYSGRMAQRGWTLQLTR